MSSLLRIVSPLAAALALALPTAPAAAAGLSLTTLHAFTGKADGRQPDARLTLGTDGNLYGTTADSKSGVPGTVYRVSPDGTSFKTLHSFISSDGRSPEGGLVQAADGAFYGTTTAGGQNDHGTAYKLDADGHFTLLHSFTGTDGDGPSSSLIIGQDGNFYGTALRGGDHGQGVVFRMTPAGDVQVLHAFAGPDGANPHGGLVQGADGALYGTTQIGGGTNLFYGIVFKLTLDGVLTTVHAFSGADEGDGANPMDGLTAAPDGTLYGTTTNGGHANQGTVFRIRPDGRYAVLHSFAFKQGGIYPFAGVLLGADGLLYGSTTSATQGGQIFTLSTKGKPAYTVIHDFDAGSEGLFPQSALVQATDGTLYGTTSGNSAAAPGDGTVYALKPAP